jgi:hypothetical protein
MTKPITPSPYGVLQKKARKGLIVKYAEQLKPASEEESDDGSSEPFFFVTYVTDNGKERRLRATREVWKKVHGPSSDDNPHMGLDMRVNLNFRIVSEPEQAATEDSPATPEMVIGIDVLPKHLYKRGMIPEKYEGMNSIVVKVNQKSGDIEVVDSPPKVQHNELESVLKVIDSLSEIHPGDPIGSKYEVESVAGNTIVLEPKV